MAASGNYIVESDVDNWPEAISATEDFATTDVALATEKITVANDIATCTELKFSSTGVVPAPLVTGTIYYAIRVDATHIQVALTPVLAAAGTAIDLTDVGSGTHTLDIGSGSSETERQEVIDRAEQLIEKITHDYFYAKAFQVYRDGTGSNKLFLGFVPHVLSVTEVLLSGIDLDSSWWTVDINSVYLDPEVATAGLPELLLRASKVGRLFPRGMGNIKITGTYGWASCPAAIKRATIMLCRYENDETLYEAHSSGDLKSEKIGDYAYTLSDNVSGKSTVGIDEIDKLIKNYIRKRPMMGKA